MSKQLSLKDLKGRLEQIPAAPQNLSGSKEHVVICGFEKHANAYLAIKLLHKNGLTLRKSKNLIDAIVAGSQEEAFILPRVEDPNELQSELSKLGFHVRIVTPGRNVSVRRIREKLGLTQEQFAVLYRVELRSLQNYEANEASGGHRKPAGLTAEYFSMIERYPDAMKRFAISSPSREEVFD
ncbi:helix-turn-helix domain-containing protein [Shimia sp.]|uniref:helix-turn-helix domain-containing protein n=1 Tax=Shimia sp. TaxID=1954381 RepID=UPI003BA90D39